MSARPILRAVLLGPVVPPALANRGGASDPASPGDVDLSILQPIENRTIPPEWKDIMTPIGPENLSSPLPTSPTLSRLVVEEHFRSLSLLRRLGLALRLVLIRRAPRAGTLQSGLSDHIRNDIGLPSGYERVDPPQWYPPPLM